MNELLLILRALAIPLVIMLGIDGFFLLFGDVILVRSKVQMVINAFILAMYLLGIVTLVKILWI
jgi:hypothetical protein